MTPFPGISVDVVDNEGNSVGNGEGGYLVITAPWPAMTRGIYGDPERFKETYWSRFPGKYFAGDGAKRDEDGDIWLLGRIDDVMNISGHRLSTTEVEHALVGHPSVAEAAVVGASDETTGQAIVAFVTLKLSADDAAKDQVVVIEELRSTWPRSSARSPSRVRSSSRRNCPRPDRARSCGACCATWRRIDPRVT